MLLLTSIGWGATSLLQISNIVPTVISQFTSFTRVAKNLTFALSGAQGPVMAMGSAFSFSLPIILGVSAAIAGIITIAPKLSDWWKTLTGDVEYLSEKIDEANTSLETNEARIEELQNTPWYDRTPEIEAEIEALETENEILNRNIGYWQGRMSSGGNVAYTTQGYEITKYGQRSVDTFTGETLQEAAEAAGVIDAASMSVEELNDKLKQLGYTVKETTVEVDLSEDKWVEYAQTTASELYAVTQAENTNADALNELGVKTNALISAMELQAQEYQSIIDSGGKLSTTQREVVESYNKLIEVKDAVSNLEKAQSELNKAASLTADQYYELKQLYPQLTSALNATTEGYELETQALTDALLAGEQWAWNMIKEQKELTDVSISNTKARLQALLLEQQAMLATKKLTAGEKGGVKSSRDYRSTRDQNKEIKELWLQISETEALLEELENIRGTFVSSPDGKVGGTSTASQTDPIKEQNELFKERLEIMEDNLYFMQKSGATEEEQIEQLKKMQQEVHEQADWFRSQGLAEDSEYLRESGKKWIEYYEEIQSISEESAKKAKQAWEDSINAQIDSLQDLADKYKTAFAYVASKAQDEIDALEEQKEAIQQRYDDEIAALEAENDELERQIELEQALDNLARAKQSKVMVYKDGRFQYLNDIDQVSEAQSNLDKLKREEILRQEIENLEKSRDAEIAAIDTKIEYWQLMKEEWSSAVDQYTEEQDRLIAEQVLGIQLEGENWANRLKNLQEYVNEYNSILAQLQKAQTSLEMGMGSGGSILGGASKDYLSSVGDSAIIAAGVGMSSSDQAALEQAGKEWYEASQKGDTAGMQAAHDKAESIRGDYGYSGGDWGNEYIPSSSNYGSGPGGLPDWLNTYASGTLSAPGGLSLVGENGPELRVLGNQDGIIPTEVTKNLWAWGKLSPSALMSNGMSVVIENLNLPQVTDGPSFVNFMRNNFWRKTLQFQTS